VPHVPLIHLDLINLQHWDHSLESCLRALMFIQRFLGSKAETPYDGLLCYPWASAVCLDNDLENLNRGLAMIRCPVQEVLTKCVKDSLNENWFGIRTGQRVKFVLDG